MRQQQQHGARCSNQPRLSMGPSEATVKPYLLLFSSIDHADAHTHHALQHTNSTDHLHHAPDR
jgi:hypothetical protein